MSARIATAAAMGLRRRPGWAAMAAALTARLDSPAYRRVAAEALAARLVEAAPGALVFAMPEGALVEDRGDAADVVFAASGGKAAVVRVARLWIAKGVACVDAGCQPGQESLLDAVRGVLSAARVAGVADGVADGATAHEAVLLSAARLPAHLRWWVLPGMAGWPAAALGRRLDALAATLPSDEVDAALADLLRDEARRGAP